MRGPYSVSGKIKAQQELFPRVYGALAPRVKALPSARFYTQFLELHKHLGSVSVVIRNFNVSHYFRQHNEDNKWKVVLPLTTPQHL